jgi:hypothetical protein
VRLWALSDQLCEDGFLKQWDSEDPIAITRALEQMLRIYSGDDASGGSTD